MASITVRNIDETLKAHLRQSAAANHRSMEEEARQILKQHLLREKCTQGIGTRIARRFARAGGIDLSEPRRTAPRTPPDLTQDESR